ncbi:MAG: hypothetical protein HKN13_15275 [Rhodothermales bacterium]|nr:hypothetical protein [Rhodothermales bacterium]
MDSIILQVVLQLPIVALLIFAGLLFRSLQREKVNLEDTRLLLESKLSDLSRKDVDQTVRSMETQLKSLTAELDTIRGSMSSSIESQDRVKEYMDNQKTALKEFGRVLSRTSEQTYGELQQIEDKITVLRETLSNQGFEFPNAA